MASSARYPASEELKDNNTTENNDSGADGTDQSPSYYWRKPVMRNP